jgi:AcrR family transcriptional regulator
MWMSYPRTAWYVNDEFAMAYKSDLRAAQKRDTRNALIDAAVDLCFAQGIEGPSLDAICAAAGCTRGAFYVHFKTREDIVIAAMEHTLGQFVNQLLANGAADADPAAFVDTFLAAIAARTPMVGGARFRFRHLLEACARYPVVRKRYLMIIDAATASIRARLVERRVPDAEGRAAVLGLISMGLLAHVDLGRELDLDAVRTVVRGLVKGR